MPKLQADYVQTLVGNWGYWIPAQLINFRFVPSMYQVRKSQKYFRLIGNFRLYSMVQMLPYWGGSLGDNPP